MIEIIKNNLQTAETSCLRCQSVLRYNQSDVYPQLTINHGRWNEDYQYVIDCPVCGNATPALFDISTKA